ncbi:glycosyltransferase family 2 protein [Fulvimarina sp. MAC8]|uniref:glycosyltransferase family 2 protein n=1 Tax=Fulvimarina sp. MAC8 TaxID=3162874 RepID=UPI0032F01687
MKLGSSTSWARGMLLGHKMSAPKTRKIYGKRNVYEINSRFNLFFSILIPCTLQLKRSFAAFSHCGRGVVGASVVHSVSVVESHAATEKPVVLPHLDDRRRRRPRDAQQGREASRRILDDLQVPPPAEPVASAVFRRLGISASAIREAWNASQRNGTDVARELIFEGVIGEVDYAAAVAMELGLRFESPADRDEIIEIDGEMETPFAGALRTCNAALEPKLFVFPTIEQLPNLSHKLRENPVLARWCRVTTLSALRDKELASTQKERFGGATLSLSAKMPEQSARAVVSGWQGAAMSLGLATLAWWLTVSFWNVMLFLHVSAALCFTAWISLRFWAAVGRHGQPFPSGQTGDDRNRPVYSVLVALHNEREVVSSLVAGLEALNWPKSRIEIFLVCEEDDLETVALCQQHTKDKPQFQVILVPPGNPRTKPKALNHVLPIVKGEFLVLYDAEDTPHPEQLREAFDRYRSGPDNLACLQAPLVIRNAGKNWLTGIFAMEYAGLFRAFLPFLSHYRLPIPLGGTSNHFKVSCLKAVGGWDSHNVTEDADLGMRMKRAGYEIETISLPTQEDAPEVLSVWVGQRTRWLKGWIQTYAVHMRDPSRLIRDLGFKSFIVFQLLFHGMITAALLLPLAFVLIGFTLWLQWSTGWAETTASALLLLDLTIFCGGFLSFVALTLRGARAEERRVCLQWLPVVPIYWLCVSRAAYRGLFQLFNNPHAWEKTAHGLASRADKLDPRYRLDPIFDIAVRGELISK